MQHLYYSGGRFGYFSARGNGRGGPGRQERGEGRSFLSKCPPSYACVVALLSPTCVIAVSCLGNRAIYGARDGHRNRKSQKSLRFRCAKNASLMLGQDCLGALFSEHVSPPLKWVKNGFLLLFWNGSEVGEKLVLKSFHPFLNPKAHLLPSFGAHDIHKNPS